MPGSIGRRRPHNTPPARPRVLVVDGHQDTREMYATALSHFGFETVTADDAARAVERARATHPDLIVTEVALPQHDGFRLLDDLKRDAWTRAIPVIVVTSLVESAVRERAGRAGCAAVLGKPCLPEDLARVVRTVLAPPHPLGPGR
jgi:CheY-like chemotaxis protein